MSRRNSRRASSRRQAPDDEEDDDDVLDEPPPQKRRSSVKKSSSHLSNDMEEDDDKDDSMLFSSQAPEMTQEILPVRNVDRNNLNKLSDTARDKAISDLTRLILFKGLAGEPIDRLKCIKEAGIHDKKISSAVFEQANIRLKNIFDFELRRMPTWMEQIKSFPKTFKDRYYLINTATEDELGQYSKALHSVHNSAAVEKGLLMTVLALCYCQGEPRHDGSRWILQQDLYTLLHRLDESLPAEPPNSSKRKAQQHLSQGNAANETPDVDVLLHKFVNRDYLVMQKVAKENASQSQADDAASVYYTMGPRAGMEIGRKQILYFCAEILDQEPDPTMLLELQQDEEEAAGSVQEED